MVVRRCFRLATAALALSIASVACGDGNAPGESSADALANAAPVAEADFAAALTKAVCDRDARCGCSSAWGASQSCESAIRPNIETVLEQRQGYDPQCGGRLVAAYATASCGEIPYLSTCRCALFHGDLKVGAPCSKPDQCASGSCGGVCYGRCPREVGESCSAYEYCRSGSCQKSVCVDPTGCVGGCGPGTMCNGGACVALKPLGAACSASSQCASDYCPRGACDVLPREGEACPASRCADGLSCQLGDCPDGSCAVCKPAKSCPNPYPYLN